MARKSIVVDTGEKKKLKKHVDIVSNIYIKGIDMGANKDEKTNKSNKI